MAWENFIISDAQGTLTSTGLSYIAETPPSGWSGVQLTRTYPQSNADAVFYGAITGGSVLSDGIISEISPYKISLYSQDSGRNKGINFYENNVFKVDTYTRLSATNMTLLNYRFFCLVDESRHYGYIGLVYEYYWGSSVGDRGTTFNAVI